MNKSVSKFIVSVSILFLATSCDGSVDSCACYDSAINQSELSEECKLVIGDMTEEELKDKLNECFEETVKDLSGAVGL
jgi:hypothetical protein